MKRINERKALEEILKIGKAIYEKNNEINSSEIFGKDTEINILPQIEISDIVAILTDNLLSEEEAIEQNKSFKEKGIYEEKYKIKKGDIADWTTDIIYDYYEDNITLQELIKILLEE